MIRLACFTLVVALLASGVPTLANAQALAERTTPSSLTLTSEQWSCLNTRLQALLSSASDKVRVPLSPCGVGAGVRGPGVSNSTASATPAARSTSPVPTLPQELASKLTRPPLYLSKGQLDCLRTQIPKLSVGINQIATVDLAACQIQQ